MKAIFKFGDFIKFEDMPEEQIKPVIIMVHPHGVVPIQPTSPHNPLQTIKTMTFELRHYLDEKTVIYEFTGEN